MSSAAPSAQARIAHAGTQRTRIRLDRDDRQPERIEQIRRTLQQHPGVKGVEVNQKTGSLLVHHDTGAVSVNGLAAVLGDLGVVVQGLHGDDSGGHSETAQVMETALGDLNQRVATATGGKVDLKIVVPGAFLALGVWRLAADIGSFFTSIPGYVLVWYAFDSYTKLHHLPAHPPANLPSAAQGGAAPTSGSQAS